MVDLPDPCFETCRVLRTHKWGVVVTWAHSLRQHFNDLDFSSEKEAELWIRSNAAKWLATENHYLTTRRVQARLATIRSTSNTMRVGSIGSRPMALSKRQSRC
jgi:hypothetical protein